MMILFAVLHRAPVLRRGLLAAVWGWLAVDLAVRALSGPGGLTVISPPLEHDRGRLPIYGEIELQAPKPAVRARVEVTDQTSGHPVPGRTAVAGVTVRFIPDGILPADRELSVRAEVWLSEDQEPSRIEFTAVAEGMGDRLWVDVRLSVPQRVVVYRGETAVRRMVASAGLPGQETPKGVYRLQNRGEQFFSWRYRQGGYYWVRFLGNYLFHSVPFDEQGRLLTEEEAKLGCPASHGCVRLSLDDARWFYDNVPDGTLVVVRE